MNNETFEELLRPEIIDQEENGLIPKCHLCFEGFDNQHLRDLHLLW